MSKVILYRKATKIRVIHDCLQSKKKVIEIDDKKKVIEIDDKKKIINKGSGAGGANTLINGLSFENKTSIENKLLKNNFEKIIMNKKNKYGYYFQNNNMNKKIIYLTQSGFKLYCKKEFNIDIYKQPDEAFIIIYNNIYHIKILEKKNQNVDGSVEDKLKTGQFNKREYEKMFKKIPHKFNIYYAFCISKFLQDKFQSNQIKYNNMIEIMKEDDIKIFYGEDEKYFDILFEWINTDYLY